MLKIVLELSDKDLKYFRKCLQDARKGKHGQDESLILSTASALISEVAEAEAPDFVSDRIGKLRLLIDMLEDAEWRLAGADRTRVLSALAYFVNPDDLIPDRIPGIGYLDDAIMVELVVSELVHEITAYEKFCAFRSKTPRSEDAIQDQRSSLQSRMRRRRREQRESRRSKRPGRSPLGLF
jgi:uncharacterized membrane protein YkvA (DUF1232 family)